MSLNLIAQKICLEIDLIFRKLKTILLAHKTSIFKVPDIVVRFSRFNKSNNSHFFVL